jgi:hypothetical protein
VDGTDAPIISELWIIHLAASLSLTRSSFNSLTSRFSATDPRISNDLEEIFPHKGHFGNRKVHDPG